MAKRATAENAISLLRGLVKKTDVKHVENTERLIHMTEVMEAHIRADAEAFQVLGGQLLEVNKDVKSLLQTRSFLRGTWFAVVTVATFIGVVIPILTAWWPAIRAWVK